MVSGALAWLDGPTPPAEESFSGFALSRRWLMACFVAFAAYAFAMVFTGGNDGAWARWAVAGYAAAAIATSCWRRVAVPLLLSLAFGIVAPVIWLVLRAPAPPDVVVVSQSARLLLHHGSPYLPAGQLTSVLSYNPYLPAMALFGVPHALDLPGLIGDTRPWLVAATLVLFFVSFWIVAQKQAERRGAAWWAAVFAVGSPVLALELTVGITDGPVIALVCLALACVARSPSRSSRQLTGAGLAVGLACAMKFTAWPALPVIAAMLWARDGRRVAARFTTVSVVTAMVGVAAFAPALLAHPGTLVQNVVLFPLGLTQHKTPAASPVPGHILASIGSAGHSAAIAVLIAAGAAVGASLVLRPPADVRAATLRLTAGLVLLFALAPASRFGYFCYPIALLGWLAMTRHDRPGPRPAIDGAGSSAALSAPTATPSPRGGAGSAATGPVRPG
jgi:hypothetical protein